MKIDGTRFGLIEYETEDVVTFEDGLVGFPELQNYLLLNPKPESPFRWLQSLEEPRLAFLVADPTRFVEGYEPEISDQAAAELELEEATPRLLLTTAVIPPGQPQGLTLNLAAPIVVNVATRAAAQVVLEEAAYTMRHRVFHEANQVSENVAA